MLEAAHRKKLPPLHLQMLVGVPYRIERCKRLLAHQTMKISELAKRTGVGIGMIRYYEEKGILTPPERRVQGGYRLFSEIHVRELEYIKEMKHLGFKAEQIKRLRAVEEEPRPETLTERDELLRKRLAAVEEQIAHLSWVRSELLRRLGRQ